MSIDAPLSVRATAESQRLAARDAARQYVVTQADARRDQRIEEAKASAAARPTLSERVAETPPRPQPGNLTIDVLA